MATGTGKTITAISAMVKVLEKCSENNINCGIVIVVPYKVLLEQWVENLNLFDIDPIKCYDSRIKWENELYHKIKRYNNGSLKNLFVITTNSTFNGEVFQKQLNNIRREYIFCIDEMHHAATNKYLKNLPQNTNIRLGLSATLDSLYNNGNLDKLKEYFGGIVYNFSMKRAIDEGFLTPYYYNPIFVELTNYELEEYKELSEKITKLIVKKDLNSEEEEILQRLLLKRARILYTCENKLVKLKEMKDMIKGTQYNIFYCGDKIEDEDKYIHKVNRVVANDFSLKTHTFTAEESKKEREEIISDFKEGKLDAISAIRCLDEGVDIPELRTAFILSSSTNPKEFIQRRGRVLRLCNGKEYATIYDFMVIPSLDKDFFKTLPYDEKIIEKKIFDKEVKRFIEFSTLAINCTEAYNKIMDVWDMYDFIY
ncbi:DEAD/DEAH box helicase family protein [Peptacetobacter hiranonis]|nr:DEAD/DEAH box helicase family protein [Peptacetobacter hiranonis]